MLSCCNKKNVHFFSKLNIKPIGIYKIIENQLLNKLPEGINGNIFMSKDKYKKTRDKFLFL